MKKGLSPVTLHYTLITGGFWMAFCVVTAYAAVYLQGIGCSNAELGLILALGNVGGALLSPVLGAQIDRNRNLRHATVVNVLLAIQVALLIVLRVHPRRDRLQQDRGDGGRRDQDDHGQYAGGRNEGSGDRL